MNVQHVVRCLIAAAGAAWLTAAIAVDSDTERGSRLVYACLGCHGSENYQNAYPRYPVPKLGGQNAAYVVAALESYAAGDRWHPTMKGYASTLGAVERTAIAAWFASVGAAEKGEPVDAGRPEKAELCVACHGRYGEGTLDEYPDIGGQHAGYLEQALHDYRRGRRRNAVMAPFASQLTDDDIEALSAWFSRQPGLVTPGHD